MIGHAIMWRVENELLSASFEWKPQGTDPERDGYNMEGRKSDSAGYRRLDRKVKDG